MTLSFGSGFPPLANGGCRTFSKQNAMQKPYFGDILQNSAAVDTYTGTFQQLPPDAPAASQTKKIGAAALLTSGLLAAFATTANYVLGKTDMDKTTDSNEQ